jgi:predicted P-loop ATPase
MFKDRDNAELKSLSTKVTLKIRRPYDKFVMAKHRLASLCATGNQERFLTDDTGNRRWLCFRVANIDNPRTLDDAVVYGIGAIGLIGASLGLVKRFGRR